MELDFENICRICLNKGILMSIYKVNMSRKIMAFASVQIQLNDGLPAQICNKCSTVLYTCHQFKKQCEKSDLKLRQILASVHSQKDNQEKLQQQQVSEPQPIDKIASLDIADMPYSCKECNKVFSLSGDFKIHLRMHSDEKSFHCTVLDRECQQTQDFKHMRTHTEVNLVKFKYSDSDTTCLGVNTIDKGNKNEDTTTLSCNICKHNFSNRSNLRGHIKKFHASKLEDLAPKKIFKSAAVCKACNKTFVKNSNLKRHVKMFHEDKQNELLKRKKYPYNCDKCPKRFTHLRNFKSHLNSHLEQSSSGGLKCILCNDNSESQSFQKSDLLQHFQERHNTNLVTEMIIFTNSENFKKWKKEEELRTNECFINAHGTYKTENYNKTKYICHRSGIFKSKGHGLRRLKSGGSKKIDGFCPAEMSVKIIDGNYEVKYIKTHIGHSNDL